jgi:hypothetical protein
VGLALLLFWPLGLYQLARKMKDKRALIDPPDLLPFVVVIMMLIGLVGVIGGIVGASDEMVANTGALVVGLCVLIIGTFVIAKLAGGRKDGERFRKLRNAILDDGLTEIDAIARAASVRPEVAIKDIQDMIDIGFLRNVTIDRSRRNLVVAA